MGTGIVAVASGLVQVKVGSQTPGSERIDGVRNLGQAEAVLFRIVLAGR